MVIERFKENKNNQKFYDCSQADKKSALSWATISLMLSSNFMELFKNKSTIATFNTTDLYLDSFSPSDIFEFSNFSNYILQTINASFRAHSYKTAQDYIWHQEGL